jgi:hypothetical protein
MGLMAVGAPERAIGQELPSSSATSGCATVHKSPISGQGATHHISAGLYIFGSSFKTTLDLKFSLIYLIQDRSDRQADLAD